jgi:hypothetical protein
MAGFLIIYFLLHDDVYYLRVRDLHNLSSPRRSARAPRACIIIFHIIIIIFYYTIVKVVVNPLRVLKTGFWLLRPSTGQGCQHARFLGAKSKDSAARSTVTANNYKIITYYIGTLPHSQSQL